MEARERMVDEAYNATYEWMLNSPQYLIWKHSSGQRLLIRGKAGCGKSTLMKHLFAHETSAADIHGPSTARPVVCGFFFNGRGSPTERTLKAMLRTLLHQIVFQNPTAYRCIAKAHRGMEQVLASRNQIVDWTEKLLTNMLEDVMLSSTLPTLVFIDALDEGDGFSAAEVFGLLEKHTRPRPDGQRAMASVCLSSRPDNFVDHRKQWTTLNLTDFNSKDIEMYTASRLNTMANACADSRYQQLATELVPQIVAKADGVFLWVRLVVDEITTAMERGEDTQYFAFQLSATPTDLWNQFREILLRVNHHHIPDMQRLLQVVLVAERPLSVEELAHVLSLSSPEPPQTLQDLRGLGNAEQVYRDTVKRIRLCCGGLVEVVHTSRCLWITKELNVGYKLATQVQFIHQSVKDYLNSAEVKKDLSDMLSAGEFASSGHQRLLTACLKYLQLPEMVALLDRAAVSPGVQAWPTGATRAFWEEISDHHPLLLYSPHWVIHADESAQCENLSFAGRETVQTMETVFHTWRFFPYSGSGDKGDLYHHIYSNMDNSSDEISAGLLSFSAYQGYIFLFKEVFNALNKDMTQHTLGRALIAAACDCGLASFYRRLVCNGNIRDRREAEGKRSKYDWAETIWQAKEAIVRMLLDGGADANWMMRVGHFGSALTAASWSGRVSIVQVLLDNGAIANAEVRNGDYGTALIAAAWGSSSEVIQVLIHHGADVNAQVRAGLVGSALSEAAISGSCSVVQTLIDHGAEVDLILQNGGYGSALAAAAGEDREPTLTLLIKRGARVNMQIPGRYGSALAAAALSTSSSLTAVKIMGRLVDAGAEVNLLLKSGHYGSALAAAAVSGQMSVSKVKFLLQHGADINLQLGCGLFGTALIAAACSYNSYVQESQDVEGSTFGTLIEHGAEVDARPRIGIYGSALAAAAFKNELGFVHHLLARGADANAILDVGIYGSALAAAASCWDSKFNRAMSVVLALLMHGADINASLPAGSYGSALGAVRAMGSAGSQRMKRLLTIIQSSPDSLPPEDIWNQCWS
jgi:ankyrin repeat protein/energy-coupling factor transporter ATP-binding protein EcfA2